MQPKRPLGPYFIFAGEMREAVSIYCSRLSYAYGPARLSLAIKKLLLPSLLTHFLSREQVKKANPGMAVKDIASKLGEQWRALSDAQKDVTPPDSLISRCSLDIPAGLQEEGRGAQALNLR